MVSALDSGASGLGLSPEAGALPALCSRARHFTLLVPLYTQELGALA